MMDRFASDKIAVRVGCLALVRNQQFDLRFSRAGNHKVDNIAQRSARIVVCTNAYRALDSLLLRRQIQVKSRFAIVICALIQGPSGHF